MMSGAVSVAKWRRIEEAAARVGEVDKKPVDDGPAVPPVLALTKLPPVPSGAVCGAAAEDRCWGFNRDAGCEPHR